VRRYNTRLRTCHTIDIINDTFNYQMPTTRGNPLSNPVTTITENYGDIPPSQRIMGTEHLHRELETSAETYAQVLFAHDQPP
jgi:hypothetical protein